MKINSLLLPILFSALTMGSVNAQDSLALEITRFHQLLSAPEKGEGKKPFFRPHKEMDCKTTYFFNGQGYKNSYNFYLGDLDSNTVKLSGGNHGASLEVNVIRGTDITLNKAPLHVPGRSKKTILKPSTTSLQSIRFYFPDYYVAQKGALTLKRLIKYGRACMEAGIIQFSQPSMQQDSNMKSGSN